MQRDPRRVAEREQAEDAEEEEERARCRGTARALRSSRVAAGASSGRGVRRWAARRAGWLPSGRWGQPSAAPPPRGAGARLASRGPVGPISRAPRRRSGTAPTPRRRPASRRRREDRRLEGLEDVGVLRDPVGLHGRPLGRASAKISPIGRVVEERRSSRSVTSRAPERLDLAREGALAANTLTCCSGAVSQAATSLASSTFLPWDGTVRNEPPQLPPPPGKTLAMSQPLTPSALPWTTPSIQPGQAMVAKPSFWKHAVQSSPHCGELGGQARLDVAGDVVQTALSSGFSRRRCCRRSRRGSRPG